jgi:polysaccharide biosynthesis/export protein
MRIHPRVICLVSAIVFAFPACWSQTSGAASPTTGQQTPMQREPNYILAPNDQITIRVPDAEELNDRTYRIDAEGNLTLPLIGVIKASGVPVEQLEAEVTRQLKAYIRSPQVSITVTDLRSDPVFLTGAFARPGMHSLQPPRTLIEMLSSVGGLQANASRRIRITRRLDHGAIPLQNAVKDSAAGVSIVEINLNRLMETSNAVENIVLAPYDVLYAAKGEMVYINLEGSKAGAYPLDDRDSLSVLQLISLAGGLDNNAEPENARVLRPILNTSRRAEIPVNIKAILQGRENDYPLMPNDLLMIPRSRSKLRPLAVVVPALVTSLIFVAFGR